MMLYGKQHNPVSFLGIAAISNKSALLHTITMLLFEYGLPLLCAIIVSRRYTLVYTYNRRYGIILISLALRYRVS